MSPHPEHLEVGGRDGCAPARGDRSSARRCYGDLALLAVHGGRTAQIAWLSSGRLITVSVTSLHDDTARAITWARSIAALTGGFLEDDRPGQPMLAARAE